MSRAKAIYNAAFRALTAGAVGGCYIAVLTFLFVFISGPEALALHPWAIPLFGLGPSVLGVVFLVVLFAILPLFSFVREVSEQDGINHWQIIVFVWAIPLAITLVSSLVLRTAAGGLPAVLSGLAGVLVAGVIIERFPLRSLNLLSRSAKKLDRTRLGGFGRGRHA